jgi:periplasmic protein TonB
VIGLHALVFSALMAMKIVVDRDAVPEVEPITPPLRVEPLPREKPPEIPLDPVARRSMPSIPVVIPVFPTESVVEKVAETVVVIPAGESGGLPREEPVAIAPTALSYRATRSPNEYYPAASVRMQEEGAAIVRACVGPSGQLQGRPEIERSSGSRSLDAAALAWVREAVQFTPATRNGEAISACKGFRVNFTLR